MVDIIVIDFLLDVLLVILSRLSRFKVAFPKMRYQCEVSGINEKRCPTTGFRSSLPFSLALGIMKSLAVGLTWPRIKFTSFQGCQSSVEFLSLIFPSLRPGAGKERAVGIS